jgi:hypothetical protein
MRVYVLFCDNVIIIQQFIGFQVLHHTLLLISLQTAVIWVPVQVGLVRRYHCKSMSLNAQAVSR